MQTMQQLQKRNEFDDWSKRIWWFIALKIWIFNWWKLSILKNTNAKLIRIFFDRSFASNEFTEYFIIERVYLNNFVVFFSFVDTIVFFASFSFFSKSMISIDFFLLSFYIVSRILCRYSCNFYRTIFETDFNRLYCWYNQCRRCFLFSKLHEHFELIMTKRKIVDFLKIVD